MSSEIRDSNGGHYKYYCLLGCYPRLIITNASHKHVAFIFRKENLKVTPDIAEEFIDV
jgi:hypothetical protein